MNEFVPLVAAPAAAAVVWWRGRAVRTVHSDLRAIIREELCIRVADAGVASLPAVAAALALDGGEVRAELARPRPRPRTVDQAATWEARETIRLLGLDLIELVRGDQRARAISRDTSARGRSLMAGRRHGRDVVIKLNESSSLISITGAVEPFEVHALACRWEQSQLTPDSIREWLDDLAPTTRWNGVCIEGGMSGVTLRRHEESARSWMHDLWLAEQLAEVARLRQASPAEVR